MGGEREQFHHRITSLSLAAAKVERDELLEPRLRLDGLCVVLLVVLWEHPVWLIVGIQAFQVVNAAWWSKTMEIREREREREVTYIKLRSLT